MVKNILWDFDGVILDSMPIRDYGFRIIFKNYSNELVEKFIQYHRKNGGLSRFHKIKYFYNELLGKEINTEKIQEYANEFTKIMREELTNQKYLIDDSVDFIKNNYKKYNFHIVSGSEEKELNFLCENLGLSQYFITIEGSPTPKNDLIKNLIEDKNYKITETILIGDSINDYEAARENRIKFYGFNNKELKDLSHFYIDNFNGLKI